MTRYPHKPQNTSNENEHRKSQDLLVTGVYAGESRGSNRGVREIWEQEELQIERLAGQSDNGSWNWERFCAHPQPVVGEDKGLCMSVRTEEFGVTSSPLNSPNWLSRASFLDRPHTEERLMREESKLSRTGTTETKEEKVRRKVGCGTKLEISDSKPLYFWTLLKAVEEGALSK